MEEGPHHPLTLLNPILQRTRLSKRRSEKFQDKVQDRRASTQNPSDKLFVFMLIYAIEDPSIPDNATVEGQTPFRPYTW
eukprot:3664517-Amphidinium_carterae.1